MTRTGLVLGAGGILGSAWMTGALPAVQERIGRPLGELDLVLGTSAGAVLGAALRCGMSVEELLAHQHGATPHRGRSRRRPARHAHHRARVRRRTPTAAAAVDRFAPAGGAGGDPSRARSTR